MLERMAHLMHRRVGRHVELDDLRQDGALGLLKAARRFDPHSNDNLEGFSIARVRGAMLDGIRRWTGVRGGRKERPVTLPLVNRDGEIIDVPDESRDLAHADARMDCEAALSHMKPRQRRAVEMYMGGMTLKQVGKEMGLSYEGVRKVIRGGLERVKN